MRKLMWFTLGFGAACAIGSYCYNRWLLCIAIAAILCFVASLVLRKKWAPLRQIAAVFLGTALGLGWFWCYNAFYLNTVRVLDGQERQLTVCVSDYSYESGYGSAVKAELKLDGKAYQTLVYLKENKELKPGDQITGSFRLRLTHDGKEADTYHRGNGLFLLAYCLDQSQFTAADAVPAKYFPAVMRRELTTRLDEIFPSDVAFFTKALLLGDRTDVDYETNTAFKVTGISHIIAVSGLHISILFSVIFLIAGKKRALTAVLGIPLLLLFAAVAGFTPSITRACIMQIIMILALLLNREYDPPTALSVACLVMLAVNPVVITSASFQLSVGCMAGVFLFSGKLQSWILDFQFWRNWKGKTVRSRLRHWFASGISVTVSAMFFTTPLVAYYFGTVSLISIVTNLLTLWAVSWIFYGILVVCLLSFVWTQGASFLAWLLSWLIRYVLTVAKLLASIPLAAVYTKSIYIVVWLALCYVLVLVFMVLKMSKPFVLICCCVIGLCTALFLSWLEPLLDNCRMTMLDVGQGQCILLQSQGKTFLVDCGGDSDTDAADQAAETLLSMGISHLDGVILTHYDGDHAGGVGYLLSRVTADTVYLPKESDDEDIRDSILRSCQDRAVYVEEDLKLTWGGASLTVYAPLRSTSDNERSLCVLFREENCDILITGDMEISGENLLWLQKDIPELTVLVAGHHGSKYSTGEPLLAATTPEYALISVGVDNSYGHPSREVLARLEKYGCIVYRTDRDGTIVFRR